MDAVIVLRTQVERGEAAMRELRCQRCVATDQRGGRVAVAFGLKNLVALNRAELANRTIDRANKISLRQRTRAITQWSRKKFIEALITGDIRIRRLGHVDLIARHKPANQARGQMPRSGTRNFASEDR